jgi:hypothetical protein
MRKLAPVFFSSVILLTSASAFALGDMNKNKKSTAADTTSQTNSATYNAPAANGGTGANEGRPAAAGSSTSSMGASVNSGTGAATTDTTTSLESKPSPTNDSNTASRSGTSSSIGSATGATGATGAAVGSMGSTADKSAVKGKKKQVARNDNRCDQSAHPGVALPKDCLTKSDTGAAAVNSTQGQSGGASQ